MSNRVSVCLGIYAVVVITAAGIMAYLLLQPCGIELEVVGENNKVRNQQKIDILSLDLATDGEIHAMFRALKGLKHSSTSFLFS